jgi:hypothetical protein
MVGNRRINPPRHYLSDLFRLAEAVGAPLGILLILLSLPGIFTPLVQGGWAEGLPWLPAVMAAFSSFLMLFGVVLLWRGLRRVLRFTPFARPRFFRHRR